MTFRRWLVAGFGALALLLVVGRLVADGYADFAWYRSLGATEVWRARFATEAMTRSLAFLFATAFAFGNLLTVRRSIVALILQRRVANLRFNETVPARLLTAAAGGISVVVGVALALASVDWRLVLARSGEPFGEIEATYFDADVGFFVNWMPFETALWQWALLLLAVTGVVVVSLYVLAEAIRVEGGRPVISAYARRHLTALAGIGLMMLAWYFRLGMYQLIVAHSLTTDTVPGVVHSNAIPAALVLSVGVFGAGAVTLWTAISGQFRLSTYAIVGSFVLWVLAAQVVPTLFPDRTDDVDAQERVRQRTATGVAYTRRAFGADQVRPADSLMVFASLSQAANAVQLWDPPALRRAIAPTRVPDTTNSWIGWRATGGGLTADVVVRGEDRDDERGTWLVEHVDAGAADGDGGPIDAPDTASVVAQGDRARATGGAGAHAGERGLAPPIVFPGADGYALVPDSGEQVAGVPLDGFGIRLACAWSLQNPRLAFARIGDRRPTLVMRRDLRARVDHLVPFLVQGSVITPAVVGDSLYWMIDLYAASRWYPLSRRIAVGGSAWTYFRHAAVAVVAARTGDVVVIADAHVDAITKAWERRFPTLFSHWNALPATVQAALPPPLDAAHAIATALESVDPQRDTPRHPPPADGSDSAAAMQREPVYMTRDRGTTAVAVPLLDVGDHVAGALIVTGGRDRRVAWADGGQDPATWSNVLDELRASDSAGTRRDSRMVRGRVRAVPVRSGLAYVQPLFRWQLPSAPALVAVHYLDGPQVGRAASLREAFNAQAIEPLTGDWRVRAGALYDSMRSALGRGDWEAYGRAFDALGRLLGRPRRP